MKFLKTVSGKGRLLDRAEQTLGSVEYRMGIWQDDNGHIQAKGSIKGDATVLSRVIDMDQHVLVLENAAKVAVRVKNYTFGTDLVEHRDRTHPGLKMTRFLQRTTTQVEAVLQQWKKHRSG
jgi:hypothetical protein